jgi:hypothetical protein
MSSIDMALLAFTTFNAIRVPAYFPQMAGIPAARPTAPHSIAGAGRAILGRLLEPTTCRTDSAAPERTSP